MNILYLHCFNNHSGSVCITGILLVYETDCVEVAEIKIGRLVPKDENGLPVITHATIICKRYVLMEYLCHHAKHTRKACCFSVSVILSLEQFIFGHSHKLCVLLLH